MNKTQPSVVAFKVETLGVVATRLGHFSVQVSISPISAGAGGSSPLV